MAKVEKKYNDFPSPNVKYSCLFFSLDRPYQICQKDLFQKSNCIAATIIKSHLKVIKNIELVWQPRTFRGEKAM